jgi:hypothetical protein
VPVAQQARNLLMDLDHRATRLRSSCGTAMPITDVFDAVFSSVNIAVIKTPKGASRERARRTLGGPRTAATLR